MEPTPQTAAQPLRVFISYSRHDAGAAVWLRRRLEAEGVEVFRDVDDTLPGEEWWHRLANLISIADGIVFLLSPRSAASKICADEVAHAQSLHKRLIPVVIEDVEWSSVPDGLAKVHGVTLLADDRGEPAFKQIYAALSSDIEWLRQHTRLGQRARQWRLRDCDASDLLTGKALEEAEQWLTREPGTATSPTLEHQAFIAASREAERTAGEARLREIERQQREFAEQRDRAEQSLAAARKTAGAMASGLVDEFQNSEGVPSDLVRRILARANALVDTLAGGGESSIELTIDKIATLSDSVDALLNTGKVAQARDAALNVLRMSREAAATHPADERCLSHLAIACTRIGNVLVTEGELPGALAAFEESLAVSRRGDASEPGRPYWRSLVASAHSRCGDTLSSLGRYDEAQAHIAAALDVRLAIAADSPGHPFYEMRLAETYDALSHILQVRNRDSDALAELKKSNDIRERLGTDPSDTELSYALSMSYMRTGGVQMNLKNLSAASLDFELCVDIRKRLVASDPSNMNWRSGLARAQARLADALFSLSKTEIAMGEYDAAIANFEDLVGRSPSNISWRLDLARSLANRARDSRPSADKRKIMEGLKRAGEIVGAALRASPESAVALSLEKFIAAEIARQGKSGGWRLWR